MVTTQITALSLLVLYVFRNHVDNNLVNAMETQDNVLGPTEGVKAKATIMFKISCTSNTSFICCICMLKSVCVCLLLTVCVVHRVQDHGWPSTAHV